MTHLKKSLAMLLALIMMFSSMSVAATAWEPSDDPSDISFTVKFFRESPKDSGNWIETKNAAPGDNVKARVYVKTGFYTYGGDSCFLFDKTFFTADGFVNNKRRDITVNDNYAGPSDDDYGAGEYELQAKGIWKNAANFYQWNEKGDNLLCGPLDYITGEIEGDPSFFDTHDLISHNIEYGSTVTNSKMTDDDWMYEFDFVVNDNTATNTIGNTGEAEVPPYYYSIERTAVDQEDDVVPVDLFINFLKGENGAYRDDNTKNKGMWLWVPEFSTNPGSITTTSEIVFDMGLVDKNGVWYEDTYTTEKGIINKEADLDSVANPTHPEGKVFAYWSTQKPAKGVTQAKASAVAYDYDVQTLYAVWTDIPDVSYTLKEFYMNADGSYPADVEGVQKDAQPNSTVSAPESTDDRFYLDKAKSSFDVVVKADGSSVVNAYYIRNTYNLVYHYEDMAGEQTDTYPVRFGDKLPAFGATPSGEPAKTGYTFLGWTTTENGTTVETLPSVMPAEELHLYPVYEAGETYDFEFIFNAEEGAFADGGKIKRYSYNYLQDVVAPEEPTAPGKRFIGWDNDIPAKADGNKNFNALYEDVLYTVTFMADTDEDGTYETTVSTKNFAYGEKLYTEFAPENYPADAWKLADGTAVTVSDGEDAYTVTESVTLYTVGKDEYPANFYWSEEDLEKGEEPYKTVYVKYEADIPVPEKPEKPGYNFIAWTPDVESGLMMDSTDGKDFVAIFDAKTITVTFDPNEGTCDVTSDSAKYGESIEALPTPSRDGYEFIGWINPDNENVGKGGVSYAVPTEDVTLTAKWEAEEHTITFLDDNGSELGKIEDKTDEEITVPSNLNPPVRKGHKFTGWVNKEGKAVNVPETMPAEDMVLTATWNKLSYEFNADANGGVFDDGTGKIADSILYDAPLSVEQPDWAGHKFLGWAYADDESNTIITLPETMPDKAISIKAVWDTNKHSVKYDANSGVFTNEDGSTTGFREFKDVEYGDQIPKLLEIPTKEGYTFVRWNTDTAYDTMPDTDVTFTAEWEKIPDPEAAEYKIYVSYPNPANPEETLEELVVTDSALPGTSVEVIKAGEDKTADKAHTYEEILAKVTADGIEPNYNNRPEAITVTENGDKIVVAFKLTEYTVEFNPNGGKFGDSEASVIVNGTWGQTVNVPAEPTRRGYTFTGWNKTVPETFTENVVISATWKVQVHNAIFIVNDENGNEIARIPVEYEYGETIVAPVYTAPDGYKFNGWDIPAGAVMGESDMTFTSTLEPITFELSYEISGLPENMSVSAPATQSGFRKGEEAPVAAAPVVKGYEFDGWYNGEDKYDSDGTDTIKMPEDNVVLTGTYTAKYSVITFDANGGEFSDGASKYPVEAQVGAPFIAVPDAPTKDGYKFIGWTDVNGNPTSIPEVFPEEDVTIKAAWSELYDVTYYDADGKVFEQFTDAGVEGAAIPVPENKPVKEGSGFAGWVDADGNPVTVIPKGNVELYPSWSINKHTVTYNAGEGAAFDKETGAPQTITFNDVAYGEAIPAPETNPEKEGFDFVRWTPEAPEAMPDSDLEFVAEWKEIPAPSEATYEIYAVTYNPANPAESFEVLVATGSGIAGETVEVIKSGETSTADKIHTYEELVSALKSNSNEPDYENRTEKTTLAAGKNKILVEFKLTVFEATFNANGGYIVEADGTKKTEKTVTGYYGQPVAIPGDDQLDYEGYDFMGWDKNPAETFTENAVYNATWDIQIHDVDFIIVDENGDEVEIFTESFEYGEEIVAPEYTAPEGYEFNGWGIPEGTKMGEGIPSEFKATLTPIGYKLTYVISGLPADKGVSAPAQVTGLHVGEDVDIAEATQVEGYDFIGWTDDEGNEYFADGTDTINMPASDVVLNGVYTAKEYTITFDSNGAEEISSATYKCDEVVETLPTPTKDGFTFAGWYEGETKVDAGFKMPARNIALTAKWDKEVKYSIITLDANGGQFSNGAPVYPVKAEVGVPFNAVPANPTRKGYDFVGWTDENGNATSIPKVFPAENVTIKAKWAELYDVTYYDEDGVTVIKAFVDAGKEGADIPSIDNPQKEGYRFIAWEGMPADGKIPASDLKLVATYEEIIIPKYTITYKSNGVIVHTASYEENDPIDEYNLENVEGKTFKGWNPALPDNMLPEDITVEAVWETNKHDITLDANGGKFEDGTAVFTDTLDYGTALSGKIPATPNAPEGHEFAGWYDSEGNKVTLPDTMPDYDIDVKAKWEPKEYTITFDSNGGSDVPSKTYKYGDKVTAPANPTRDNFKFIEWSPALPNTMPARDITVVAQWEALVVTKTLTINANGGEFDDGSAVKTETLAVGEEIKALPVPEKDGYDFAGWVWTNEEGETIAACETMPAHNVTVTATWTPVAIPEHNVEYFYAVDGALYDTLTFKEGEAIVHPTGPVVEGLTFKGWADENGNALPAVMGNEDLKAYAQFDVNSYKVTYIVDGEVYKEYSVLYQAEVPVPVDPADSATRLFAGWQPEVESTMPAHDLTYTATWVGAPEPDEYTATYLRADGTTHAKYVLEEGDAIPVPAAPQKFGYVFVGWEPEVPATMPAHDMVFEPQYEIDKTFVTIVIGGTVVAGGVIAGSIIGANIAAITGISIVGGIIVIVGVAELIKHTHTVTYIVDGEVYKTYKVVEGTKIPVPADPVKDGFTFEGWNPEVPEKMGNTDLVFEATWSEKTVDDSADVDVEIPETGSVAGGLAAFAVISGAAAAAYVITKRKKED